MAPSDMPSELRNLINTVKVLRKGKRTVGDLQGEEWLVRMSEFHAHEFIFEARGEKGNTLHPNVTFEMFTGVKGDDRWSSKPSLTDEEAMALFDRMLDSVRVRPGAVAAR